MAYQILVWKDHAVAPGNTYTVYDTLELPKKSVRIP